MRMTQVIGLSLAAHKYLDDNCNMVPNVVCPDCGKVISEKKDCHFHVSAESFGMFNDGPLLYMYIMKDGTTLYETVQCAPWSSGPCIFLCLSRNPDSDKPLPLFEWTEEEMSNVV